MDVLDERDGLRLVHEYETVILEGAEVPNVIVGDHYGDPIGGLIDREGAWVASIGEGVQVYRIAKPYTPYEREVESGQWVTWDAPKGRGYEVHVSGARQDQDGRLVISVTCDEPYEVSFEVWLSEGSIVLVADDQSVRETGADKRIGSNS